MGVVFWNKMTFVLISYFDDVLLKVDQCFNLWKTIPAVIFCIHFFDNVFFYRDKRQASYRFVHIIKLVLSYLQSPSLGEMLFLLPPGPNNDILTVFFSMDL